MKETLDKAGIVEQDQALRQASGHAIYNTSKFTMKDLKARSNRQQLKADSISCLLRCLKSLTDSRPIIYGNRFYAVKALPILLRITPR